MGNNNSCEKKVDTNDLKNENWYILALSLEYCVKPALLEILHDPQLIGLSRDERELYTALLQFKGRALQDDQFKHIIKKDQWDSMCHICNCACPNDCPRNGKTNSEYFDITIIVFLIRNYYKKTHKQKDGWKNVQQNDNSKATNIILAREMRNEFNHSAMAKYLDVQIFKDTRNKIRSILQGLGVTDFNQFDQLENLKIGMPEKKQMLKIREYCTIETECLEDKKSMLEETLNSYLLIEYHDQEIQTTVVSIEPTAVPENNNKNETKLKFHLKLTKKHESSSPFTIDEIKMNGPLHRRILKDIKLHFHESCGDIADTFEIIITEISPEDKKISEQNNDNNGNKNNNNSNNSNNNSNNNNNDNTCVRDNRLFQTVKFHCEVYTSDTLYLQKNLKDSFQPKAEEIIQRIETSLPLSLKEEFQLDTKAYHSKWEVGSLLVDISLQNVDGTLWDPSITSMLKSHVEKILQNELSQNLSDPRVVIHDVSAKDATNIRSTDAFGTLTLKTMDVERAGSIIKYYGRNIKHATKDQKQLSKTCTFKSTFAGIIIGKNGSEINRLKEIPDIKKIYLDTNSIPNKCVLTIEATNQTAIQKVVDSISKKIDKSKYAKIYKTLIETSKDERHILLSRYEDSKNKYVVPRKRDNLYIFEKFQMSSLEERLPDLSIHQEHIHKHENDFLPYTEQRIQETFQAVVDDFSVTASKTKTINFNIIPGKIVLLGQNDSNSGKILTREKDGSLNINAHRIKPIYITSLNPSLKELIFNNLENNDFKCIRVEPPYTTIHLTTVSADNELIPFTVNLALDENLNEVKEEDKQRHQEINKNSIHQVFEAKTIGEVLQLKENTSVKVSYRKLSLLVHPDKTSHPGATEAFQKLNHAYNELQEKNKPYSTPALDIGTKIKKVNSKPPKVLSVDRNKTKVCTITTFGQATLDLRASVVTLDNSDSSDTDTLSEKVRDVLNNCWENRDDYGGIQTPDGETGILISLIKQITAAHIWVKEIETAKGSTFLLEVTVREIRQKNKDAKEWENCLEIHINVQDDRDYKMKSASEFTQDFLYIKEEWERICPIFQ